MSSAGAKKLMNSGSKTSNPSSKSKIISSNNNNNNNNNLKKKIESSSSNKPQQYVDSKNKSAKTETKGKAIAPTTPVKKAKREKKVYSLPGQKHDPPEEREPLRIFYESLSKQIPTSEMAEFWMMEHGMLSPERAKRAFEKKQRKQKQLRMGTPVKSLPLPSRPESSNRQKLALKTVATNTPSKTGTTNTTSKTGTTNTASKIGTTNTASKIITTNTASKNDATNAERKSIEDSDDKVIASPKRRKAY